MKKALFILSLATSVVAGAQQKQSLKDLLYSGKLKLDSTSVIKKDDDLTLKIDTSTKKPVVPEPTKTSTTTTDSRRLMSPHTQLVTVTDSTEVNPVNTLATEAPTPTKSNSKIWKEYSDSLVSSLKSGFLASKKIKKETYFLTVDYEIGTDGTVSINNVVSDPENPLLQSEVKQQMEVSPPKLAPVLDSNNTPRKTKRKFNFSITKD